jgi:hypothetical protein
MGGTESGKQAGTGERLLHEEALAGGGFVFAGGRLFLDLAETELEHFGDIYIGLCASLDPGSVILSCKTLTLVGGDLSESPIRIQVGTPKAATG